LEVNIFDLVVSHVVHDDEGHPIFTKAVAQYEDIISSPNSNLVLNVHNVDNCIVDSNAQSEKTTQIQEEKTNSYFQFPKKSY
jgi:hypothetical protein